MSYMLSNRGETHPGWILKKKNCLRLPVHISPLSQPTHLSANMDTAFVPIPEAAFTSPSVASSSAVFNFSSLAQTLLQLSQPHDSYSNNNGSSSRGGGRGA